MTAWRRDAGGGGGAADSAARVATRQPFDFGAAMAGAGAGIFMAGAALLGAAVIGWDPDPITP